MSDDQTRAPARPAPISRRETETTLASPLATAPALDATRLSSTSSFRPDDPLATRVRAASLQTDVTAAASLQLRAHAEASQLPGEGDRVGRFIVLRELGRGAMGVVFAAFDEELARRVAVKLLHLVPGSDASTGRSQLLREAQALARLTHPNVVGVYEAGVWRGSVYVAMEYVQGVDLQAWLAAEQRPWRATLAVLRQAGEGLLAAHRSGLVHRDFKPSNVLVGDDGRARVADFGLAARRGEPGAGDEHGPAPSLLTSTIAGEGALVGTPVYMAPEQIRRGEATAHSDQFAFCVALYEALYGVRPFRGDDFVSLAHAIEYAAPPTPPPGAAAPPWLFPLVARGLAKDPALRWPSLAELLAELSRDPEAERARRRRLGLQLLATMTLTVLVIVGSVRLYAAISRHNAERRADARLAELRLQLAEPRVQANPGEAERLLAAFAAYPDNRGTAAVARAHLERAAELADPAAAVDAYAGAFLTATDPADEITALRGLIPRLVAAGRHLEAGEALATLDRRAPELSHDPELALARRTAALRLRDLPAARAALDDLPADDPMRTYGHVLENMSHATALDPSRFPAITDDNQRFTTADLDGDGRPELAATAPTVAPDAFAMWSGAGPLRELGVFRTGVSPLANAVLLPRDLAGGPLLMTTTPIPGAAPNLRHALVEALVDGSVATRLSWDDAPLVVPVAADLDHDGRRELYLGAGTYTRRLQRADRDADGGWRLSSPSPKLDLLKSDLNAMVAGDLDGDGREELVVAAGPWRAFDVRVMRADASGGLVTVARRSLGMVSALGLLRVDGELRIAAAKQDEYASAVRFSARAPFGPPAGLYVLALRGGELVETDFHPTADLPGVPHLGTPMFVADLDGDAHDDLLVRAVDHQLGASNLVIYRQHADRLLPPLVIHGVEPRALLELDDDPAPELFASEARVDSQEVLVIGLGADRLAPLAVRHDAERPVPAGIADPALAAAWHRTEEMVTIGLPQRSAAELSALAGPSGHVREDLLFRAGELYARAGEHAAAAEHFVAAAKRPELAAEALAGAIRSRRALGEITAETELAERRAALPGLGPEQQRAAEAELAVLRRATAPRTHTRLRFDRPLDPRWQVHDPLRLTRDPSRQALRVHSGKSAPVAALPLRHDGGTIVVTIEMDVELAEWGSEVAVLLRSEERQLVALSVGGRGGTDAPYCLIESGNLLNASKPAPPIGTIRLRHAIYPELGLQTAELDIPGEPTLRRSLPLALPLPPRLDLRLAGGAVMGTYFSRAFVREVELEGLVIDDSAAADPEQAIARAIVEGEHLAALAALPPTDALAPGDPRLLWRAALLARIDQQAPAAEALARALAVPEDSPIYETLATQLQYGEGAWISAVRRALGPHSVRFHYPVGLLQHPWRPGAVDTALAGLATWPRAPDPAATATQRVDHLVALIVRGEAWHRFGRLDLAHQDLAAAAEIGDDPDLGAEPRLLVDLRQYQLAVAAQLGDRSEGLALATRMFADALSPEIFFERLKHRDDLVALFTPADWAALAALAHE